jgi:hypothetical protein
MSFNCSEDVLRPGRELKYNISCQKITATRTIAKRVRASSDESAWAKNFNTQMKNVKCQFTCIAHFFARASTQRRSMLSAITHFYLPSIHVLYPLGHWLFGWFIFTSCKHNEGRKFTAHDLPWWSPIQVLTVVDVTLLQRTSHRAPPAIRAERYLKHHTRNELLHVTAHFTDLEKMEA